MALRLLHKRQVLAIDMNQCASIVEVGLSVIKLRNDPGLKSQVLTYLGRRSFAGRCRGLGHHRRLLAGNVAYKDLFLV